jgi:predicted RNA binding protein YcfA (HicA-like mRNA interferase family)
MSKRKLLRKVLGSPENTRFGDMVSLVEAFGFRLIRVRGSHHIFKHPDLPRQLNLQRIKGQVKPYQIRQFLAITEEFNLPMEDEA